MWYKVVMQGNAGYSETVYVPCGGHCYDHTLRFSLHDDPDSDGLHEVYMYLDVGLQPFPWWKRPWSALKYLFNRMPYGGMYYCWELFALDGPGPGDDEQVASIGRLQALFQRCLNALDTVRHGPPTAQGECVGISPEPTILHIPTGRTLTTKEAAAEIRALR